MTDQEGLNLESVQEIITNWMGTAASEDKLKLIKGLFAMMTLDETGALLRALNRKKRRKKRNKREQLSNPKKTPEDSVPERAQHVSLAADLDGENGGSQKTVGWWTDWPNDKIVAIDCEYVHYNKGTGLRGPDKIKAARVSIVNRDLEVLYEESIRHNPRDCEINAATIAKNGITKEMVTQGKPLEQVREAVRTILEGKLVIVCSGETDFRSLGLEIGSFDTFDLHSHWFTTKVNNNGVTVVERISLKKMAKKHLGLEIQRGYHSATEDAQVTMRMFRDVYPHEKKNKLPLTGNCELCTDFESCGDWFCGGKK